ncbi:hypothetical protein M8C21_011458, partial [Ambrosia artemisiifolia]
MGDVAKDLAAGTVGGVAQLVVGHPFDTIKVKLQSQPTPLPGQLAKYSGAIDAVRKTLAAEGAGGLYKGMGAPLATVAAFNALLFTVRGQMETVLRSAPGAPLTVNQQFVAGAGAGVAVSFLATPTELIKCRLQAQGSSVAVVAEAGAAATAAVKYGGPIDVAKQVLRSEGGIRGLYKGLFPTLAREVPGNATMFGVYEALKQYIAGGTDTSGLGRGSLMLAGGLAGGAFWVSVYPTDVVKSVIQIDDYKNPKYSGSIDAFKKILKAEGIGGLYKGFGPAMARSVPANAACFLAYEITSQQRKKGDTLTVPKKPVKAHIRACMKHITRNPNISRWRCILSFGKKNNECVPLKTPIVEAKIKTDLLDRVESLEDRLIQLSLEIETRRASRTATQSSTLSGARELAVSSYPVFNNPKPKCKHASSSDILPLSTGGESQNEFETSEQQQEQMQRQKSGDNQKTFKNGEKKGH